MDGEPGVPSVAFGCAVRTFLACACWIAPKPWPSVLSQIAALNAVPRLVVGRSLRNLDSVVVGSIVNWLLSEAKRDNAENIGQLVRLISCII